MAAIVMLVLVLVLVLTATLFLRFWRRTTRRLRCALKPPEAVTPPPAQPFSVWIPSYALTTRLRRQGCPRRGTLNDPRGPFRSALPPGSCRWGLILWSKKKLVADQLKACLLRMRAVPSPKGGFCILDERPLRDALFWAGGDHGDQLPAASLSEPFATESELNDAIIKKCQAINAIEGRAIFYQESLPLVFHDHPDSYAWRPATQEHHGPGQAKVQTEDCPFGLGVRGLVSELLGICTGAHGLWVV
ncbi:hypothetical protein AYL99_11046 [Fonsecaea erecta]|uniref:Uncharacterized protein n=1 Tax=Fonsecaea erecta TaxID=1367422 RepID=A0A178Z4C7_9EURO|nr:hypothetical protein AYL99_11046 [Fonsecaea erecta]OAP54598.1 hypothetical protein AYL99_11046 [Fonsecaea erecta]